ncbi:ABC transporter substrate-binding protein [Nocardioides alcanivorans]|uniref:ABC transporter substrate-binding protein n=1 Tax=Nocardioides alcanivorans TaxID=2897352 RepID=UPI001F39D057|nr:ABC transporter substrate-binding protein [Nocardioides alcanivorans]
MPNDPKRIVALWRVGSELADLCVVPVGQLDGEFLEDEIDPAIWSNYKDIPTVGNYDGLDIEKLIELDPDLVIGMDHGGLGIDYEEVAELFPTVILGIEEPTNVWDNYPQIADLVGRSTDYEEGNAAIDAQLAEIKEEFGDELADLRVTSLNMADQLYVDTSKSLSYRRMDAAGFVYNPDYTSSPERYVEEFATENLADLADQDIIFYEVDRDGEVEGPLQEILDSASFKRLPAVKAGNVFPLATGTVYTFDAAQLQVDDLRDAAEGYEAP